jgi:hypothetical protein
MSSSELTSITIPPARVRAYLRTFRAAAIVIVAVTRDMARLPSPALQHLVCAGAGARQLPSGFKKQCID